MKQLYLECYNGISGDMTVGALLDLGAEPVVLQETLSTLPLTGYKIKIEKVKKMSLAATDFAVCLEETFDNKDHDMQFLYGHHHSHNEEEGHHHHSHNEEEGHHHHSHNEEVSLHHHHRNLQEVLSILEQSCMSKRAKATAEKIFTILGEAEATSHGTTLELVHFHEVGAVDSIIDIAAVAICLDLLDIGEVIVPQLYEGSGTIRCAHGLLPIPVPAVSHIAKKYKIPLSIQPVKSELVTPTGAAIVAAITTSYKLPEAFIIEQVGIGTGKRNQEHPSILRALLIDHSR